jgi:hypothetical protein
MSASGFLRGGAVALACALGLARASAASAPSFAAPPVAGSGFTIADLPAPAAESPTLALGRALPTLDGPLAQRSITREWGLSDDSTYSVVDVPGLRSEALAALLSGAVPGAGQFYAGENSAWWYALAEVAGWTSWSVFRHGAQQYRVRAAQVAGAPDNPQSAWSFSRWAQLTQNDAAEVEALYTADPEAFYHAIADDPRYQAGWSDAGARDDFAELRSHADHRASATRLATTGLWLNHLVASLDALRAVRINNFPLRNNLHVRMNGHLSRGRPGFAFALERSF